MLRKALLVAGLVVLPAACSDDQQETQDPMDVANEDGGGFGASMDELAAPQVPDAAPPSLSDLAKGAQDVIEQQKAPEPVAQANNAPAQTGAERFVRSAVLRVRSGPGLQNKTVGYVTFNMVLQELSGSNARWVRIGPGKYVSRHFVSLQPNVKQYIPAH